MATILTGAPTTTYTQAGGPVGTARTQPATTTTAPAGATDQSSVSGTNPYAAAGYSAVSTTMGSHQSLEGLLHQQGFNNSQIYGHDGRGNDPSCVMQQFLHANPSIHDPNVIGRDAHLLLPSTHHAAGATPGAAAHPAAAGHPATGATTANATNPDLYHTSAADLVREGGEALDQAETTVGDAANRLYHTSPADVVDAAGRQLNAAGQSISDGYHTATTWAGNQIDGAERSISDGYHTATNWAGNQIDGAERAVTNTYNGATHAVGQAWNATTSAVGGAANRLYHTSTADVVNAAGRQIDAAETTVANGYHAAETTVSNGYHAATNWAGHQVDSAREALAAAPGQMADGLNRLYHSSLADIFG